MIVVKDLWKSYGSMQVLKGLNLEVYEGKQLSFLAVQAWKRAAAPNHRH